MRMRTRKPATLGIDRKASHTSAWRAAALALGLVVAVAACDREPVAPEGAETVRQEAAASVNDAEVITVIADHDGEGGFEFRLEDADGEPVTEIPSGWVTFDLDNHSRVVHFAAMYRAPEAALAAAEEAGRTMRDHWYETITTPFQEAWDPFYAGEIEEDEFVQNLIVALSESAPWFLDPGAPSVGGPGLTAGLENSRTTLFLEEGTYVLECYVKNGGGEFHAALGMLAELEVTSGASGAEPLTPTVEVTLSTEDIDVERTIRPGPQVVAVHVEDQPPFGYENLVGHDVHLIRMEAGTDVAEVGRWMNWMDPAGLVSTHDAPGPSTFLGGTETMTAGSTAYFHVDLEPGLYAWVAEVPDPHTRRMLHVFEVPRGPAAGR